MYVDDYTENLFAVFTREFFFPTTLHSKFVDGGRRWTRKIAKNACCDTHWCSMVKTLSVESNRKLVNFSSLELGRVINWNCVTIIPRKQLPVLFSQEVQLRFLCDECNCDEGDSNYWVWKLLRKLRISQLRK